MHLFSTTTVALILNKLMLFSRLAQTLVNVVGIEEALKLFGMKSGIPIYGSFLKKRTVLHFTPN